MWHDLAPGSRLPLAGEGNRRQAVEGGAAHSGQRIQAMLDSIKVTAAV